MKRLGLLLLTASFLIGCASSRVRAQEDGWISLFDGETLNGWQVGENASTFSVQDGAIVVDGPRAHLFYTGPVENHDFKNFEFKVDVMTTPGSNSGIYFHTEYQPTGWPEEGFEVQVNNSHTDTKRGSGLYDIKDVSVAPAKDNEWYTQRIVVEGNRVRTYVNDKLIVDYTEPEGYTPAANHSGRRIDSGTFAFQGHDPESRVLYKNIMVRPLPD